MSIRVVTDSNCDLPVEMVEEYGITVVPMYINIGAKSYLDGFEMSLQEFYEGLPNFETHPMTSVPGQGMFQEVYERLAAEGASGIVSIHIGSSLSAVVNSARLAAEGLGAVPVTVFDSGNLTLGTGMQAVMAAEAAGEGRSMGEIVAMSSLGSVLRLKPVLKMNSGEVQMERVRTRAKAIKRVIDLVEELGPLEELALVHTHAPDAAEALRQQAEHLFPAKGTPLSAEVTPVIGAHIGPGAVGFVAIQARQ
jgi:fatty acid-binding protein DegV